MTTPEELARRFHETYERLAPQFGYETRAETKQFDPTSANGRLMIAVAADLIESLQSELAKQRARIEKIEADIGAEMLELAERCELFADSVNEHYELDLNDIAKLLRASHSARTKAIAECLLICKERDDQDERDNGAAATGAAYLCMQDISMLSDGPSEALSPGLIESLQKNRNAIIEECAQEADRYIDMVNTHSERGDGAHVAITRLAKSIRAFKTKEPT